MRKGLVTISFVFLISCIVSCKSDTVTVYRDVDILLDSAATVTVGRVLDGDTFNFGIGADTIGVRVLDIDAFETRHGSHLDSQAVTAKISTDSAYTLGKIAKQFTDSLLATKSVLLVRDSKQPAFDAFGRMLRHVYYYEGSATHDFGALMLQKKLALVYTP